MELRLPVNISHVIQAITLILLLSGNNAMADEEKMRLLLITKSEYKPLPLNRNELRRLFLGMPVYREGKKLSPLINKSEGFCYQVFLQSIIGMSEKRYERALLSGFYRQGIASPIIYEDMNALLSELKKQESSITFLFDHSDANSGNADITNDKNLNVVQEIWISGK
ncbi:hypothetical protein MNBD_GAMMA08-1914 [hydrothermal vent metagenome]|uniref:Uncharacterized protein n=1 Tax=hydrothermal vent metagenome TaxID=652676 RepID=A0A3B0XVA3_9ZZZZ